MICEEHNLTSKEPRAIIASLKEEIVKLKAECKFVQEKYVIVKSQLQQLNEENKTSSKVGKKNISEHELTFEEKQTYVLKIQELTKETENLKLLNNEIQEKFIATKDLNIELKENNMLLKEKNTETCLYRIRR